MGGLMDRSGRSSGGGAATDAEYCANTSQRESDWVDSLGLGGGSTAGAGSSPPFRSASSCAAGTKVRTKHKIKEAHLSEEPRWVLSVGLAVLLVELVLDAASASGRELLATAERVAREKRATEMVVATSASRAQARLQDDETQQILLASRTPAVQKARQVRPSLLRIAPSRFGRARWRMPATSCTARSHSHQEAWRGAHPHEAAHP